MQTKNGHCNDLQLRVIMKISKNDKALVITVIKQFGFLLKRYITNTFYWIFRNWKSQKRFTLRETNATKLDFLNNAVKLLESSKAVCSNSNLCNFHQLEFLGDRKIKQKNAHMQSYGCEITCLGMTVRQFSTIYCKIHKYPSK